MHYVDCYGYKRDSQNTTARREDLDYMRLAKIAKRRFSKFDKINIMPMNGSDGTEAYFIADAVLRVFGEKKAKEKIFPIVVSDVDKFIIENFGQKGVVCLTPEDKKAFGKNFDKYFEEIPMSELPQIPNAYSLRSKAYKLTPFFKELFQFKTMDFQERMGQVSDAGNSIVIIRNCLAQAFGWPETGLICAKMMNILKGASLFVIGGYDRLSLPDMVSTLKIFDFREVGENIFSKVEYPVVSRFESFLNKFFKHPL